MKDIRLEQWEKLYELMRQDRDCMALEAEYLAARVQFEKIVFRLPKFLRDKLCAFPTLGHLYHQRIIALLMEQIQFSNEAE
ncbi:MAG: hypothetical protein IJ960_09760 [Oscillospiraceae bacterium]|nr:hypothetical protein [Oscillospiraceae bacterium]